MSGADGAIGATSSIFPGVSEGHPAIWHHEVIHAVQALHLDVPEPTFPWRHLTLSKPEPAGARRKPIRFEHIRLGIFNFGNELWLSMTAYDDHGTEREAYRLTESPFPIR